MSTPPPPPFRDIRTWVFDLDNTLYPPSAGLLDQVNVLMSGFIQNHLGVEETEANHLRRDLWERYGATLTGLREEHGVDAVRFLEETHAIDLGGLSHDLDLIAALAALPGRKVIHTNGPRTHAERVLAALGLDGAFEGMVTIEDTGLLPKPARGAHETAARVLDLEVSETAMIDDMAHNLTVPQAMGMRTVWLHHGRTNNVDADYVAEDLALFLRHVTGVPV